MLDPIVNFFTAIFQGSAAASACVIGVHPVAVPVGGPLVYAARLDPEDGSRRRDRRSRRPLRLFLLRHAGLDGLQPELRSEYKFENRNVSAGEQLAAGAGTDTARTCGRSAIADVAADLTDFNVNQNAWISSMILYKVGLFGIDWDHTPLMDNKASFQRGINQAVRRTTTELADNLGRVRTTSQIDNDLQDARGNMQFDESTWYFGLAALRTQDADAELLPRRHHASCAPSTRGCPTARPCSTRAPTI